VTVGREFNEERCHGEIYNFISCRCQNIGRSDNPRSDRNSLVEPTCCCVHLHKKSHKPNVKKLVLTSFLCPSGKLRSVGW
jgi:hypothetical protein